MAFTFGWALAILVVMYYVSSVLSTKTRARIGTMIFFSVFILIGYWTIFPADIIATSQIPVIASICNLGLLINVGSPFDLFALKQDWRVAVITLVGGCIGICSCYSPVWTGHAHCQLSMPGGWLGGYYKT